MKTVFLFLYPVMPIKFLTKHPKGSKSYTSFLLTMRTPGTIDLDTRVGVSIISCYEQKNNLVKKKEYNKMVMCCNIEQSISELKISPVNIKYIVLSPRISPEMMVESVMYIRKTWNLEIDLVDLVDNYIHVDLKNKKIFSFDAEFISGVSPHTN